MSTTTNQIIEKLKSMTLAEAAELVSQIEDVFGVNASAPTGGFASTPITDDSNAAEPVEEQTYFDVILEDLEVKRRVSLLKVIRNLTSLGIMEAKEFTNLLPKALKEGVSKEEAETAKQQLEEAGGKVKII